MVLYKEKLNLKPPGGSGFAPHLDTPSLRVALGGEGPQTFVTVMVAIDNMTTANGCLRICKGEWSEQEHCTVIQPEEDGNPDAGGRAGAIPAETAHDLEFHDVECQGGDIVAFNGWAPHRSSANASPFPRRAVFLTYNPKSEGDFHDRYYERMEEIRNAWRSTVGLSAGGVTPDEKLEIDALATIPHI
jgi:ectoine hydroxylase-related dioxygenase (phytanoyl-CoA dioxygenase family)